MKFTKTFLIATAIGLIAAFSVSAQTIGVKSLLTGGTTTMNPGTTNQFIVAGVTNQYGAVNSTAITSSNLQQNISEFDNVGFTFKATGIAATTNGIFGVRVFRSYDGGTTFETVPYISYTNLVAAPNGAATWTVATNLNNLLGATHLGFSLENACANGGYLTNVSMSVNLKSAKLLTKQATQ